MPLGGGNFTSQNKVLPGAYANFIAQPQAQTSGSRGTATLPLAMAWGEKDKIITLQAATWAKNALAVLGYEADAPELLVVRETMKRAQTLKLYRLDGEGIKATATIGGISWTAACAGTRGNALRGAVQPNIDDESAFDVLTYLGTSVVARQTVATAAEIKANAFVTFGAGTLVVEAAKPLQGGTNSTVDGVAYTKYLDLAEAQEFDAIGYTGTDNATKAVFAAFAKRLNDQEGKKLQCVLGNYAADHPAIINVRNGVVLADGTTIPAEEAVAWVTGATAAAQIYQSLTNAVYEGAVNVDQRLKPAEYEAAVTAGQFVFYAEAGQARVVADVNSLVNAEAEDWQHNRVVRTMNAWGNDVARIFGTSYMGQATNNETMRNLLLADLISLGETYAKQNAIEGFETADVEIAQGDSKRDVVITCALRPNDSMEKLYMTVYVQ